MTEYNETVEDNNVGICIDCKHYRARQKREKYPHCIYMSEAMILRGEQIHCKKYEWKAAMTDYEKGYKDGVAKVATQLAEAKRLLKLAVKDMHIEDMCDVCMLRAGMSDSPIKCPDDANCFIWRYKQEAEKLLKED